MSLASLYAVMETGHPDDNIVKVVVPNKRFVWLWIPKNAGGSISRTLVQVHGDEAVPCEIPLDSLWKLNPDIRNFRVVAFKRNPFTRIVSCWLNKIADPASFNPRFVRKYHHLRAGMPFPEFAEWLTTHEGKDDKADPHWQSQHLLLDRATEILAFEDLPDAVASLGVKPRKLPHRNQNTEAAETAGLEVRPLLSWYDARSVEYIRQRYAEDLAKLGYDVPEELLAAINPLTPAKAGAQDR